MPTIKQSREFLRQAVESGQLKPASPAPPIPPTAYPTPDLAPALNPLLRAPMPAESVRDADTVRQWHTQAIPQTRIWPPSDTGNPVTGAQATSQAITIVRQGGGGTLLETNSQRNAVQGALNLLAGSNVQLSSDAFGGVTITGAGDGLVHGDAVWEYDPAYFILRDDFAPYINATMFGTTLVQIGELGWQLLGGATSTQMIMGGGAPNFGQFSWANNGTVSNSGALMLNGLGSTTQFQRTSFALLENPGWKLTWVFKHEAVPSGLGFFQTTKKAFYIGLSGCPVGAIGGNTSARPDIFLGLRYDTSATPGTLTLSSVANASGGTTAYTGTITGGANGAHIGITFVVTGFTNGANNGTFLCTQSSTTVLTLANAGGVTETHAGTAAGGGLNDSFYTFETVANGEYTAPVARHNAQGITQVTNVAPTPGAWHRLDMICTQVGKVTLTLDGSATNTVTFTIPQITVTTGASGQASSTNHVARVSSNLGTSGTNFIPPFSAGSVVTISGLTGGNAPLNGTWTLFFGDGTTLFFDAPGVSDITNNSQNCTVVGYAAMTPTCTYGNDDTASPTIATMTTCVDYFSLVWNKGLAGATNPSPTASSGRYW